MVRFSWSKGVLGRRALAPEATLVILVALVVAAFIGATAWVVVQAHGAALEAAEGRESRLVQSLDEAAGRFFRQSERMAIHLAGDFARARAGAFGGTLDGFAGLRRHILDEDTLSSLPLGIVDAEGRVALTTDPRLDSALEAAVASQPDRFRPPAEHEPASLFLPRRATESTAPVLLAWRVYGPDGGFLVVVIVLDPAQLRALIGGPVGGAGAGAGLATLDGEVLFQSPERDGLLRGLSAEHLRADGFGSYRAALGSDGGDELVTFRRIGRFPVVAVAVVDRAEALRTWRSLSLAGILVVVGLTALVGVLAAAHLRAIGRARRDLEQRVRERTVNERRAAERLLAAERLTHLGHWDYDLRSRSGHWSGEIRQIFGVPPGEADLDLETVLAAIHPEDRDDECTARILASAGVKPYDTRYRIVRPDGVIRHVHAQAEVLRDDRGEPVKLIGTILDVTDRVGIERRLRESEERYRKIFEAAQDALFLVDRASDLILDANDAASRVYGHPREDLPGMAWSQLLADDAGDGPVRHRRLDGSAFPVDVSEAKADLNGQAVRVIAVRDITVRKRAETSLRLLTRAIEQSPLSVVITDRSGRIEYVNPHFVAATGYAPEEVTGRDPSLFKSGYTTPAEYRRLWEAIGGGKVWQGEFHNRMKNGELHWESASIGPVRDEDGVITHFVAVKEDITRRKRAEIELLAAKERAETANIAKSQFLATISHELRTPLNAILGFSDLIKESARDGHACPAAVERFAEHARHIHANGTNLLGLINDLLDLAKIEAGKFQLHEDFVDIEEAVFQSLEMVRGRAQAGRLTLHVDCANLPLIRADDRAMRHILINLLSNAVKFTPAEGSVTVRAWIDDNGLMAVSVADTGIGIAEADIPKVLEAFGQVDNALSRRHDGTGLGLPLCRSLVEMHGGHLEILSAPGAGTTVTVRLPRDRIVELGGDARSEHAV